MPEGRLGIGFAGAGFAARFHIQSLVGVRDADVAAVAAPTREHAEEAAALARGLGVGEPAVYASAGEMAKDPRVDAIWICVPNDLRLAVVEEVLDAVKGGASLVGLACEKPLARNVAEARRMVELIQASGLLHGYLENQVFAPSLTRGKEIIWRRAAAIAGRPYLARASEEHSGPHMPWFWSGVRQGGGVLNDMLCHSFEAARFLLTEPGRARSSVEVQEVSAQIASLKWTRPDYQRQLRDATGVDYGTAAAEDFARATVKVSADGQPAIIEATTSWNFVGPGLRLRMELFGPEYSMQVDTLHSDLSVFLSRRISGAEGEDLVEKQNAEQGLMPVIADEAAAYGYTAENRHMVERFLAGRQPDETWEDGLEVTRVLMACYLSAERGATVRFPAAELETFVPAVAQGTWRP
ncbi:MAG TPA: Gfo/Idh/MocA family oxidoreductase [Dehalococcoidia bacterium]|nr:Gfo/Idh/MocA family oxidoreductase [Dehalococcoidia bacterium]